MKENYQKNLVKTIKICIENGNRLLDDAKYLFDLESFASAYALAKLAQEEFSKSFILRLVEIKALDWTREVRRSLNHHISKQLMGIILEYLNPSTEDFLKFIKDGTLLNKSGSVCDSINIYIHEILRRWQSGSWIWAEDPQYNKDANFIYKGREDKLKQNVIYINISKSCQVTNLHLPINTKREFAEKEIEKAARYGQFVEMNYEDIRYKDIIESFKILKIGL